MQGQLKYLLVENGTFFEKALSGRKCSNVISGARVSRGRKGGGARQHGGTAPLLVSPSPLPMTSHAPTDSTIRAEGRAEGGGMSGRANSADAASVGGPGEG